MCRKPSLLLIVNSNCFPALLHPQLLRNTLLWHGLLSTEALQHICVTCLINRYLLVGLASLTTVATTPVDDEPGKGPQPAPLSPPLPPPSLAFQDALDRLRDIVTLIPRDWIEERRGHRVSAPQDAAAAAEDPLMQLKRFLSQLMDRSLDPQNGLQGTSPAVLR